LLRHDWSGRTTLAASHEAVDHSCGDCSAGIVAGLAAPKIKQRSNTAKERALVTFALDHRDAREAWALIEHQPRPHLLPHERYLMKRFMKDPSTSPKLERKGLRSVTFDIASSTDNLLGHVLFIPALIVEGIGYGLRIADMERAAWAMFGTVLAHYLLAIVRLLQSEKARRNYRRNLESAHST
jgi:hypothetical protein